MSTRLDEPEFVRSLARGLAVIAAFGEDHAAMSLSEVARRADVTRATARRLLHTLTTLGYAAFDGKRFSLKPKVLDLGYAYLSSLNLWQVAHPVMQEVVEQVHESCSASVLEGHDVIYVARVPTRRIMSIGLNIGTHLPAYATSMGRVLLSGLSDAALDAYLKAAVLTKLTGRTVTDRKALRAIVEDVRRKGWAMVNEELELGLRSIAVPIWGLNDRMIAALNISSHAARTSPECMVERFLPVLKDASQRISAAMGVRVTRPRALPSAETEAAAE